MKNQITSKNSVLQSDENKFSYKQTLRICFVLLFTCFFNQYVHAAGIAVLEKIGNDVIHTAKGVGLPMVQVLILGASGYLSHKSGGSWVPIVGGAASAGGLGLAFDQF